MILIAESGATKTDWRYIDDKGNVSQARTEGFNPYHQSFEHIRDGISSQLSPEIRNGNVQKVYFYGAGCSAPEPKETIIRSVQYSFPGVEVFVDTDLMAAARALCGKEAGIACILGTGSNSCYYDGVEIVRNILPLGFIIADEGSGADLGKQVIADYFREEMPQKLREKFDKRYNLNRARMLDHVYYQDKPGRYIAGFTKFIFDNLKVPYMHDLVYSRFNAFFEKNVLKYDEYQNLKVHFTGGVAFYFNEVLREVARDKGVILGRVVENPIAGLTLYHGSL